ncbi:MAG: KAP family NTPase [Oscillospiraceae bacterium]|nr:KAP family NTPase [Oscillospiraceae bacterium]
MTYNEINKFILKYLKNDITGRAIMLTGEWGTGKSYYIKNQLKSFLEGEGKKCAIVSLYGISDVSEISKALFFELHPIIKKSDSVAGSVAKAVGKTLINGLTSAIGFDLNSLDDDGMQKIYESVNLSDTLVVLEDIERTQIDIIKLLGYVNNLCENDGVKILLVTNESELLTTYEETNEKGEKIKYYTDSAVSYKRTREKTVGDTIHFSCDFVATIQNIIESFGIYLQKYNSEENVKHIQGIFLLMDSYNLRAFMYGCQKFKNILEFISDKHITINDTIAEIIFYGIVAFTQRQSSGADLRFETNTYLSERLGVNNKFPLFRFCYQYIVFQKISETQIKKEVAYYTEYLKKGKWNSGNDEDLQIIKSFNLKTESEVKDALANIPDKIKNGAIPYYDYGVLVNYIVAIKYDADIDFSLESIVQPILNELQEIDDVDIEALFSSRYTLYNTEGINFFEHIKQRMKEALVTNDEHIDFPYNPADIKDYCKKHTDVLKNSLKTAGFAHKIDVERFIGMLEGCSSEIISEIRSLFMDLYRDERYSRIVKEDLNALKILRDSISQLIEYEDYDKIQKMQIKWFIQNLSDMIVAFDAQKNQMR